MSDLQFGAISESDVPAVAAFLQAVFHAAPGHSPFRPDVIRWKALAPHPEWNGSRGYAMRKDGEIVGFGCLVPFRYLSAETSSRFACVLDWAAARTSPGAGAAVYQNAMRMLDGLIGVGGSDDAQRVLPKLGLKPRQTYQVWQRVQQPVQHFLGTQAKTARAAGYLGRNLLRSLGPIHAAVGSWAAERIDRFDAHVEPVLPRPGVIGNVVCARSAALLNYYLACPAAHMEAWLLTHSGAVRGYSLVSRTVTDCRLAELWVDSSSQDDWSSAYRAARETIGAGSVTVQTESASGLAGQAARNAGFYLAGRQPLYIRDSRKLLPDSLDSNTGALEYDSYYLP